MDVYLREDQSRVMKVWIRAICEAAEAWPNDENLEAAYEKVLVGLLDAIAPHAAESMVSRYRKSTLWQPLMRQLRCDFSFDNFVIRVFRHAMST